MFEVIKSSVCVSGYAADVKEDMIYYSGVQEYSVYSKHS